MLKYNFIRDDLIDISQSSPTLYEIFTRIGKVDRYLGIDDHDKKIIAMLTREDSMVSSAADGGNELTTDGLELLRNDDGINEWCNYKKIFNHDLLIKFLPKDYKRLRILVWWRLYVEPLLVDSKLLFNELKKILDKYNIFNNDKIIPNDTIYLVSIDYCLRMDPYVQRVFKIIDYDGTFNEKRFRLIINDLYKLKVYDKIDYKTFVQIFYKFTRKNYYTTNTTLENHNRSKLITEIVQRNTLGISIERPNEFNGKHCLLDPYWVIEPVPKLRGK